MTDKPIPVPLAPEELSEAGVAYWLGAIATRTAEARNQNPIDLGIALTTLAAEHAFHFGLSEERFIGFWREYIALKRGQPVMPETRQ